MASEAKHTPLPWKIKQGCWLASEVTGGTVGNIVSDKPYFECQANAELIVTAVNERQSLLDALSLSQSREELMRKALEECEEYFDGKADADQPVGCDHPIPNEEMRLLTTVREALSTITAAEGVKKP